MNSRANQAQLTWLADLQSDFFNVKFVIFCHASVQKNIPAAKFFTEEEKLSHLPWSRKIPSSFDFPVMDSSSAFLSLPSEQEVT